VLSIKFNNYEIRINKINNYVGIVLIADNSKKCNIAYWYLNENASLTNSILSEYELLEIIMDNVNKLIE
jgi:hypothetical protein